MKVAKVETQPIHERKRMTPHLYIFPTGESIVENLINRRERPWTEWKKLVTPILLKAGFAVEEIHNIKPSWSQKCGCKCGCSPGFKLNGATTFKDVFADIQH